MEFNAGRLLEYLVQAGVNGSNLFGHLNATTQALVSHTQASLADLFFYMTVRFVVALVAIAVFFVCYRLFYPVMETGSWVATAFFAWAFRFFISLAGRVVLLATALSVASIAAGLVTTFLYTHHEATVSALLTASEYASSAMAPLVALTASARAWAFGT